MKKLIMTAIFMLSSFVLSQGVYDQFDIPEFQSQSFSVSGDDLFRMWSKGDASETDINVGANYDSKSQRPGFNLGYGLNFDYDSNSDGDNSSSEWTMGAPFNAAQYFGGTRGAFGFADGELKMAGGDVYPEWANEDDSGDLNLTIGAGYGRIIDATPIAQAYAIADALGVGTDDATLLAIAGVVGKYQEDDEGMLIGFYASEYKTDAEVQFYNDVAAAAGAPDGAMMVQKVMTSPIYNISSRSTGYWVRAGHSNNYMRGDGDEDKGDFSLEAAYAMPMDVNAQFTAGFGYHMDMNEGGGTSMSLEAVYSMDHSYLWQSEASFTYSSDADGDGNSLGGDMTLKAQTSYNVLNQMSVTGSFEYIMDVAADGQDADDAEMIISSTVTYWVF